MPMVAGDNRDRPLMPAVVSPKTYRLSVFILLVALMTSAFMLTYRAVIQSGDTLRALDAMTSLARHGDWLMDESFWFKPALVIREEAQWPLPAYDVEERLNVLLATPLLKLAQVLPRLGNIHAVWLFNVIATSISVGLLYLLVKAVDYSDQTAVLVALTAGLGTNLWTYSQSFFREPLSAMFVLAALLFIQLGRKRSAGLRLMSIAAAAVGLYLAYLTKFSAALAVPALLLFALPERRRLDARLKRRLTSVILALALAVVLGLMFIDPLPAEIDGILAEAGVEGTYIGAALRSYLLSPGASIWGTSPILLLAVAGCVILWRQERYRLVLTVVLLLLGFAAGHALTTGPHWFGGLSWPPRFLLPIIPVMMLATAPIAERLIDRGRRRIRLIWVALLLYGMWIQFSGVSVSWTHYGSSLPPESQGLAEWLPSMLEPRYFRWVQLPQRWADLGFDFLWTRAGLPVWGISFAIYGGIVALALTRLLHHQRSRWRYAAFPLAILCPCLILLNLSAAYFRDPRTQSGQLALHEAFALLERESEAGDVLMLPGHDYGDFVLNHQDRAWPRTVIFPRPLAQAASDRQPAQVVSLNEQSWFDVRSRRAIQHLAQNHERVWLLDSTSPFMAWSFRPLERYLALHYYPLREVNLNEPDTTVRLLEFSTGTNAPDSMSLYFGETATDLRFGETIRLRSYALPKGVSYSPGEAIEFSLLWETEDPLVEDYTVATFIADAGTGQPIAQGQDSGPQYGFAPTSGWAPGIPIWDNRAIRLPDDSPAGDYHLWVLLYRRDSASGAIARLPARGNQTAGDGAIGVVPVVITVG